MFWWNSASTTTSLAASAASIDPTPGARMSRLLGAPLMAGPAGTCGSSAIEVRGGWVS
ncbi:hypothetical protein [Promicromonospora sp. MEB111]|uniref:hypothetical protein n=1 Tax=Promicromonospora sp. MEB111 TaxID=3040301 RepID=UPI002550736D|nr:hypothetical protein [Promicromonospora sp. MEB111]